VVQIQNVRALWKGPGPQPNPDKAQISNIILVLLFFRIFEVQALYFRGNTEFPKNKLLYSLIHPFCECNSLSFLISSWALQSAPKPPHKLSGYKRIYSCIGCFGWWHLYRKTGSIFGLNEYGGEGAVLILLYFPSAFFICIFIVQVFISFCNAIKVLISHFRYG